MARPLAVQVIPDLGGGGAEREVARISPLLNKHGPFEIVICCVMGRGWLVEQVERAGVEVVVLNERKRFSPLAAWDLVRFLRNRRPVIAHSHLLRWGPTAAKLAGVPAAIMSEHGAAPWRSSLGVLFDRANIHFADRVVAVSEATKQVRMKKWQTPASKIVTIPNAVDVDEVMAPVDRAAKRAELGLESDSPLIGIVGRLIPIKGHQYFIKAAAGVLSERPRCRFLILGEGPLREGLMKQARDLRAAERVSFLGFRSDAREIVQILDIACLSSLSEGTPITVLEAMACGKPAVVTRVGGCPEVVIDGVTGFVVPPRDPDSMAEAIIRLVDEPDLARRMGEAGLRRVREEYSVQRNLSRMLELYRTTLAERGIVVG